MSAPRDLLLGKLPTLDDVKELRFRSFVDPRGTLVPIEGQKDVPFQIARVFYVTPRIANETRGKHGHYFCSQILICLSGSCRVIVQDGANSREFRLDSLDKGLLVPPTLWAEEVYETTETILLVLCDRVFEADDYIDDEADFAALRARSESAPT